MIIDARSIPASETIETEVCIVGAGTAGIALAREFIDNDFRVGIFESGGLEPDKETQHLYWGENIGLPYFPLDIARARYLGGSTNRWHVAIGGNQLGARMRPLDPIDFEKRDWIPFSGWPFKKSHLDPFYDRAQSICKINPPTFKLEDWEDPAKFSRLPLNEKHIETVIFKFGSRDPFIYEYIKELRRAENISVYLHANVTEIETDPEGNYVKRLRIECLQGSKFWVSARIFVLAAGGIEAPRLLLLSEKTENGGLGNQGGLVGKFFMEHLHFWSGVFVPSTPDLFNDTVLYNDIQTINDVSIIGKLAFTEETMRREKLVNHCIQLIPRVELQSYLHQFVSLPSETAKHIHSRRSDSFSLLSNRIKVVSTKFRRLGSRLTKGRVKLFHLANMTEQIPNPESCVTLGDECDKLGKRRVKLNWQVTRDDIVSAVRAHEILARELGAAGLGRLYLTLTNQRLPGNLHGGYHHMGTTRMHSSPKQGVVDENCLVHGTSNLFIAGPSVFPTVGYANPVLTIVALTVRLADRIKRVLKTPARSVG
jgi:choline dehydrogenase-like flavoprotein